MGGIENYDEIIQPEKVFTSDTVHLVEVSRNFVYQKSNVKVVEMISTPMRERNQLFTQTQS